MDVVELHKAKIEKVCNKCKTVNREDANYCYKCGSKKFVNTIVKKKVSRILTKK
jgi:ribosomal protein L40E